jgi:hypothetical protein
MSLRSIHWAPKALALVLVVTIASVCLADGRNKRPEMDPRGEPEGLKKGITECFKVWHNADGWHVRVVNGKGSRDHRYQGTITVENGVVESISSHLANKNGAESQWKHGAKKNEISFDFTTFEREDGINFKASKGASSVRFSLMIDGKEVPNQIFVGKRGDNPASSTFVVTAHPGENNPDKLSTGAKKNGIR